MVLTKKNKKFFIQLQKTEWQMYLLVQLLRNTCPKIINEPSIDQFSKIVFYLPSTSDRKESINKFMSNVNLN